MSSSVRSSQCSDLRIFGLCRCICVVIALASKALGQIAADPQATGGVFPPSNFGQISVLPAAEVPMGTTVTLKSNVAVSSGWQAACKRGRPWRTIQSPNPKEISDCVQLPGEQVYRVSVGQDLLTASVVFREPNQAVSQIGPLMQLRSAPNGDLPGSFEPLASVPPAWIVQILETKLSWNDRDLGSCADLCFLELYKTALVTSDSDLQKIGGLKSSLTITPRNCVPSVKGAPAAWPGINTMQWKSPKLYGLIWCSLPPDVFKYIQANVQVGTVLAFRQHKYLFDGSFCEPRTLRADDFSSMLWGPLEKDIRLRLVIRDIPIPNQGTVKLPIWEIVQQ